MITYAGILDSENFIVSFRPLFYKYDEFGQIEVNSLELKDREIILPLSFPELMPIEDYKIVDWELLDADDNIVDPLTPSYREVKDKSDYTKYEWLQQISYDIFSGTSYPVSQNPLLYFTDVEEELSPILGEDILGGLLHIVPKTNLAPVLVEGTGKVSTLFTTFKTMQELKLRVEDILKAYAENPTSELLEVIDELIGEVRAYL